MATTLLLVAVLVLVAYTVGYGMGRLDQRRLEKRATHLSDRVMAVTAAASFDEPGSPQLN